MIVLDFRQKQAIQEQIFFEGYTRQRLLFLRYLVREANIEIYISNYGINLSEMSDKV